MLGHLTKVRYLMVENPHQNLVDGVNFIRFLWVWSCTGRQEGAAGLGHRAASGDVVFPSYI